jgi:CubicO group peptidase (beta-lactamase class C family)
MSSYIPPANNWALAAPGDVGFDPQRLAHALNFATQAETRWPRSLEAAMKADPDNNEPPPWNDVIGPTLDRDAPSGVVIRGGKMVGAYGDPTRVEMTFSVAKSYLSLLTGIALDRGLIKSLDDTVREYGLDDDFDSKQNRAITWRHLLYQSSEWTGTLFSKPDLIDHHRQVGVGADNSRKGQPRELHRPGTFYEYNDVRVNRLSLSLMQLFEQPLETVLRESIMVPLGASDTWSWKPYFNSEVDVNGQMLASVPGGSHWGGGIFINSEDHARVALMVLREGQWGEQQIVSREFLREITKPSPCFDLYGMLWWLNTEQRYYANAPQTSFFAMGAGTHLLWIDRELDLVAVFRWIDNRKVNELIGLIVQALKTR